jgi:hypothetical protein
MAKDKLRREPLAASTASLSYYPKAAVHGRLLRVNKRPLLVARDRQSLIGRGCAKTLEPPMLQCIFGHVGPISRDFIDSNRALSNLHGMQFWF